MKMLRAFMVAALVVAVSTGAASAQPYTYDWTAVGGGAYDVTTNWGPSVPIGGTAPPVAGDTANWDLSALAPGYTVTFNAAPLDAFSAVANIKDDVVSFALATNTYTVNELFVGVDTALVNPSGLADVGVLTITDGTVLCHQTTPGPAGTYDGYFRIGYGDGTTGTVNVGAGGVLTADAIYQTPHPYCAIGYDGDGALNVTAGGQVNVSTYTYIGGYNATYQCDNASLLVDGLGSAVNLSSTAIGKGGNCTSTITVTNGGHLTVAGGNMGWGNVAGDLTHVLIDGSAGGVSSKLTWGNFQFGVSGGTEANTFKVQNGGEITHNNLGSSSQNRFGAASVVEIGVVGAGTAHFSYLAIDDDAHMTVGANATFTACNHYCQLEVNGKLTFVQGADVTLGAYGIFMKNTGTRLEGNVDAKWSYPPWPAGTYIPLEFSGTVAPGKATGTPSDQIGMLRFEKGGKLIFQKGGGPGTTEMQFCSGVAKDCSDKIVFWKTLAGDHANSGVMDFTGGILDYSVIGNGGKFCPVQGGFLDFFITTRTMTGYNAGGMTDNMHTVLAADAPVLAYTYHDGSAPVTISAADIAAKGYDPLYLNLLAIRLEWTASPADFDASGLANVTDVDIITRHVFSGAGGASDLDGDADVDIDDQDLMVRGYMQTEYGDANLDHKVNTGDLAIMAGNWMTGAGMGWADGDFNGDQAVNTGDLAIMAGNWMYDNTGNLCSSGAGGAAAVPEPATLCLLSLGAIALLRRRRR